MQSKPLVALMASIITIWPIVNLSHNQINILLMRHPMIFLQNISRKNIFQLTRNYYLHVETLEGDCWF